MLLPLIHSEEMFDHEMAYHFMELYLQDHPGLVDIKKFWKDHTNAIKKFYRYPHRNKILGRESTKEEVEKLGIHVGCVVTYEDEFMILNEKYYVGRALDNRMGGFMIAEVARLLSENKDKLPFGLYITNAVQEEIGLRGAQMIVETIQPNVAIVTDVTHDTNTPMLNKIKQGDIKCGEGPVIYYGPAVQNNLLDLIISTAEKNKIPFQRGAASRATGTDTCLLYTSDAADE